MSELVRKIYVNSKQDEVMKAFLSGLIKIFVLIWGRGAGKSTILGDYLLKCVDTMPRSRGLLCGPTLDVVKNYSLPSIQEHWERMGLVQGVDYVIGKRPPADWDRPYNKITDYKNSIAFPNGTTIDMISLYTGKGGRGGSFQFVAGDEMGLVRRDKFFPAVNPARRGQHFRIARIELDEPEEVPFGKVVRKGLRFIWEIPFLENPLFDSIVLVSSMPYLQIGNWLLDFENNPKAFFSEATYKDNLAVLGPGYEETQRAVLTDLEYQIEIENKRIQLRPGGFYPGFNDDKHTTIKDPYKPDLPLDISFDFGNFNCMIIGQHYKGRAYVVDIIYLKDSLISDLIEVFLENYADHGCKELTIYGDVNGNNVTIAGGESATLFETIESRLNQTNWDYYRPFKLFNPLHAEKHLMINEGFKQNKTQLPPIAIFSPRCQALLLSIKYASMREGYKKDKRKEHPDSGTPQEEATHLSDAFDYWYYEKFKDLFRYSSTVDDGDVFDITSA